MLLPAGIMAEMEQSSISAMIPGAATYVDYIRSCKYSQVLLMMGKNNARNI